MAFARISLRPRVAAGSVGRLAFLVFLASCGSPDAGAQGKPAPSGSAAARGPMAFPVEVAPVAEEMVEYEISAVGSVDAFEVVQVTARVAGAVETVRFAEGEVVKQGAVLADIEPARFDIAVRSAKAALARANAALADATRGLDRREKMLAEGVASTEEVESYRTKLETSEAEVSSAKAALSLAQLNQREAYVRAPVGGTIQTRSVQTGQYVTVGTVLATLVKRDPLLLRFQVAEGEAARLSKKMTARFKVKGQRGTREAEIVLVSDAANPASRMVPVVAEVRGSTDDLRPGTFAEVRVAVGGKTRAAVIPQTAVRPTERGFVAFVIDEGGKARERVVRLGLRTESGLVEVKEGLKPGDALVVRGAEALRDGAQVRVSPAKGASPKPAGSSSPAPPGSAAPSPAPSATSARRSP